MISVWIIEQGEYSDYCVVGIFSTKENADQICAEINKTEYSEAEVKERPLDPAINELRQGLRQFMVHRFPELKAKPTTSLIVESFAQKAYALVWARDEPHAIKIAAERFAQADLRKGKPMKIWTVTRIDIYGLDVEAETEAEALEIARETGGFVFLEREEHAEVLDEDPVDSILARFQSPEIRRG